MPLLDEIGRGEPIVAKARGYGDDEPHMGGGEPV